VEGGIRPGSRRRGRAVRKGTYVIFVVFFVLPLLVTGCRSDKGSPEYFYHEAKIDTVEFAITDRVPPQVNAIIHGTLPDACTEIDSVNQEIQYQTFIVTITTRRPLHEVCAQTVTPFQVTIPLAVEGLPAGVYTVNVNGVTETFELETGTPIPAQ